MIRDFLARVLRYAASRLAPEDHSEMYIDRADMSLVFEAAHPVLFEPGPDGVFLHAGDTLRLHLVDVDDQRAVERRVLH